MSICYNKAAKDISFVILTSISGSLLWTVWKDLLNLKVNKLSYKIRGLRDMINLNFGMLLGFSLGINYVYTGKPLLYNFY